MTTLKPFVEVEEGKVDQRRIFGVRQDRVKSGVTGKEMRVDRLLVPDWVNVVAFNDKDELVLVRQWRFGVRAFSLEIPAGAIEAGEDPVEAGLRELVEETGHTPADRSAVVLLGATRPNSAFMQNRCFSIFVPRALKTHELSLDATEEVEVTTMKRVDVEAALKEGARRCAHVDGAGLDQGDSLLDNSLVSVALYLWKLHDG